MSDVDVTVCSKCIVESSSPDRSESGLQADSYSALDYVESCADWRKQAAAEASWRKHKPALSLVRPAARALRAARPCSDTRANASHYECAHPFRLVRLPT